MTGMPPKRTVSALSDFVHLTFAESEALPYSHYGMTCQLVEACEMLTTDMMLSKEEHDVVAVSSWLYFLAFVQDKPADWIRQGPWLNALQSEHTDISVPAVQAVLTESFLGKTPKKRTGRVLHDAVQILLIDGQAGTRWKLWLEEQRLMGKDANWNTLYEQIKHHRFLTETAARQYDTQRQKRLQSLSEKSSTNEHTGLEDGIPVRGIQTFFRSNFRMHINLSAIADNKANIMISVNSILISVLITVLSYQAFTDNNPKLLFPIVVFVVSGLTSLTFAVLAARPKVTSLDPTEIGKQEFLKSLAFFGNFCQLKLTDYEAAMDEVFEDENLIYDNMKRDLYFLGKVLSKKYHYLKYAYNVFMLGFVVTVLSFMWAFFL